MAVAENVRRGRRAFRHEEAKKKRMKARDQGGAEQWSGVDCVYVGSTHCHAKKNQEVKILSKQEGVAKNDVRLEI